MMHHEAIKRMGSNSHMSNGEIAVIKLRHHEKGPWLRNRWAEEDKSEEHLTWSSIAYGGDMLSPAYGVNSIRPKKKYLNINLIDIVNLIPNPINRITFLRNTRLNPYQSLSPPHHWS
ncbi:hypothetical protein ACH5RR_023440 [Cinchona calisaya]|uniref:Ycf2 N-terminal domain-containing protein n=1 Tax=Cinchona calisaya TaxID=153742 RepID=A0ABD2ZAR4_9GENT